MARRSWFLLLAVAVALLVAGVVGLTFVRAKVAGSRLPERARSVEPVPGCPAVVDVLFDRHGYPHVSSGSDSALFFAQGYLHARDRFFQMDLARRAANGRLAELFGSPALARDRKARTLRIAASAKRQSALLTGDERRVLDSYAAGVNAALDRFGKWIAPEVWLLGVAPERWAIEDSLAIGLDLQLNLSWAMGEELQRALQLSRLGRERAVDLWGWSPAEVQLWMPPGEGIRQPARADEPITPPRGGVGSNLWAVAADRSATARPLLANDLHLEVRVPGSFVAMHLSGPRLEVSGASLAGMPGIVVGHTDDVAWGLSLSMLDDQDLFRLTLDDLGARELVDGRWQALRTVTENIGVRWQPDPVLLKVLLSVHGPVIREQRDEALAVSWAGLHGPSMVRAILGMNRARTVGEVAAAWEAVVAPSMSLVAADTSGDILHGIVGQLPLRGRGAGRLPAPGTDSAWAWKGFRPMSDNPSLRNPEEGYLVAANHDLFGEGDFTGAGSLPGEFASPWRARRIRSLLAARSDWTIDGFHGMQHDVVSTRAIALLKLLRPELERNGGAAARELMAWDGAMDAESAAARLFAELLLGLEHEIGGDEVERYALPRSPIGPEEVLRLLAGGMSERWWNDARSSERRFRSDVIAEVISALDAEGGDGSWGEVHRVAFEHPLGTLPGIGRLLSDTWSRGPFAVGGDDATINAQYWRRREPFQVTTIPALRFVAEVGNWDATRVGLAGGQSGRPWSPHYDDQLGSWLDGGAPTMPFSREAVTRDARSSLQLVPPSPRGEAVMGGER